MASCRRGAPCPICDAPGELSPEEVRHVLEALLEDGLVEYDAARDAWRRTVAREAS